MAHADRRSGRPIARIDTEFSIEPAPQLFQDIRCPLHGELAQPPVDAVSVEMGQCFWYCSSEKAERDLGWTHRDGSETLAATVRDLRDRGVVWPEAEASAP